MASLTTKEEKELLFKELCTRLPHGVKVYGNYSYSDGEKIIDDKRVDILDLSKLDWFINGIEIKPYLRPMDSMTEEEQEEFVKFHCVNICPMILTDMLTLGNESKMFDWLNSHHFDYRGLIKMGLALEAPEGMYEIK